MNVNNSNKMPEQEANKIQMGEKEMEILFVASNFYSSFSVAHVCACDYVGCVQYTDTSCKLAPNNHVPIDQPEPIRKPHELNPNIIFFMR